MTVGSAVLQAGRSLMTLAYNAAEGFGRITGQDIARTAPGMKWEAVEIKSKDGTYETQMQQVPSEGLRKDVVGHVLDGTNVAVAVTGNKNLIGEAAGKKLAVTSGTNSIKEGLEGAKVAQKATLKNQAPKGVERIDIPKLDPNGKPLHGQQPHAHLKGGQAVNQDGTFKHGSGEIKEKISSWLKEHGWKFD